MAIDGDENGLNLNAIISQIGRDGVHDLWVEAGGRCFQSLLLQHLINRALFYVSPKMLGDEAQSAFANSIDAINFDHQITWQKMGNDRVGEVLMAGSHLI